MNRVGSIFSLAKAFLAREFEKAVKEHEAEARGVSP
jgi:hypothetical protein